ncbi:hypothetical protein CMI42_03030 [Candidatus Pacearchaeota archaeon]|nr:hypothetical protein [Candidatus Pacearchaeota archaeon]|tara:strand:+ start:550 stop:1110 length:561 start_codon:yes stop_codon:yes gene_type:complete
MKEFKPKKKVRTSDAEKYPLLIDFPIERYMDDCSHRVRKGITSPLLGFMGLLIPQDDKHYKLEEICIRGIITSYDLSILSSFEQGRSVKLSDLAGTPALLEKKPYWFICLEDLKTSKVASIKKKGPRYQIKQRSKKAHSTFGPKDTVSPSQRYNEIRLQFVYELGNPCFLSDGHNRVIDARELLKN